MTQPCHARTPSDELLPSDDNLRSLVAPSFGHSISTSDFDQLIRKIDLHIQGVNHEMRNKLNIGQKELTPEKRIDFVTKLLHRFQSEEITSEGKDAFSKKVAEFFKKNDMREWVRQCFPISSAPDGTMMAYSDAPEIALSEGVTKRNGHGSVRVLNVGGGTNNGESSRMAVDREIVEDSFRINPSGHGRSTENDVTCETESGLWSVNGASGPHTVTEALKISAINDDKATLTEPPVVSEGSAAMDKGKGIETSEPWPLATRHESTRTVGEVQADTETSGPRGSATVIVHARSKVDVGSTVKRPRAESRIAKVEVPADCCEKVTAEPVGELSIMHASHVVDTEGSVNTKPEQMISELAIDIPSRKQVATAQEAGHEQRRKGHSRHVSVESPIVDSIAASEKDMRSNNTPIVYDMKLEEGKHPGPHIPFPSGDTSPKFFSYSDDGQFGPYFVIVVQRSHALSGGLAGLVGILMYVAYGFWT